MLKEETAKAEETLEKPHTEKELSPMEMSIICSNLARGCEKQYMPEESENFRKLAEFFQQKAEPVSNAGKKTLLELINHDISVGFPYGKSAAEEQHDRGGLRCQVWAEKVTRMLQSLLTRYEVEGNKMLENTGVYVCTVCGYLHEGSIDNEPADYVCPVCGGQMTAGKWYSQQGRRYLSKAHCEKDGDFYIRVRLVHEQDALRVSRLVYEPTEQVCKSYAALADKPRPRRPRRRKTARVKAKPAEPKNA